MYINHIYKPVDPSLVLYIDGQNSRRLDNKVSDLSGSGYHGTISSIVYKPGPIGKSVLNFDGINDYVRHPAIDNYSMNLSCFVWAKAPFESYIIGKYDTGLSSRSWLIGTDALNEKRMRVLLSGTGAYGPAASKDYVTIDNVFDNQWHLYGFSWNMGVLRLDVDGVPHMVTKTHDAAFTSIYNSESDIVVGARIISDSPSGFYTGEIGEYYIFGCSVSTSESSILYNKTRKFYGK